MDINNKKLEYGFMKEIYLYSGIGRERMIELIKNQFARGTEIYDCSICGGEASFLDGFVSHNGGKCFMRQTQELKSESED